MVWFESENSVRPRFRKMWFDPNFDLIYELEIIRMTQKITRRQALLAVSSTLLLPAACNMSMEVDRSDSRRREHAVSINQIRSRTGRCPGPLICCAGRLRPHSARCHPTARSSDHQEPRPGPARRSDQGPARSQPRVCSGGGGSPDTTGGRRSGDAPVGPDWRQDR